MGGIGREAVGHNAGQSAFERDRRPGSPAGPAVWTAVWTAVPACGIPMWVHDPGASGECADFRSWSRDRVRSAGRLMEGIVGWNFPAAITARDAGRRGIVHQGQGSGGRRGRPGGRRVTARRRAATVSTPVRRSVPPPAGTGGRRRAWFPAGSGGAFAVAARVVTLRDRRRGASVLGCVRVPPCGPVGWAQRPTVVSQIAVLVPG